MALLRVILGCVLLALAWSGCGDESGGETTATTTEDAAAGGERTVYSQAARLKSGQTDLLDTPTMKVIVSCGRDKLDVSVEVKGATADAIVASYEGDIIQPTLDPKKPLLVPMNMPDIQTWTVAPFSAGETRPTVLTVSARKLEPGTIYNCGVMAQAVSGEAVPSITG